MYVLIRVGLMPPSHWLPHLPAAGADRAGAGGGGAQDCRGQVKCVRLLHLCSRVLLHMHMVYVHVYSILFYGPLIYSTLYTVYSKSTVYVIIYSAALRHAETCAIAMSRMHSSASVYKQFIRGAVYTRC